MVPEVAFARRVHYRLERRWQRPGCDLLVWVMLNPSTADADVDDPTIRRCIRFSQAWGYGGMIVGNIFALRSTDPAALLIAADPVGPMNDEMIIEACTEFMPAEYGRRDVIAAWGAHPFAATRAVHVLSISTIDVFCLGTTKEGHPRHPLYVKSDQPRVHYDVSRDLRPPERKSGR
nr:DUF1643 domain-containing protein [Sinorhizobium kostiense]